MNRTAMSEETDELCLDLDLLPRDLKRMLKVQLKELIHFIEDYEMSVVKNHMLELNKRPRSNAA